MATLGEYFGNGSTVTQILYDLNGNSTDTSGNSRNGTDNNITYTLNDGKLGQAASFNGTSSYIHIPSISMTNSWTIGFWFRFSGTATNKMFFLGQNSPSRQVYMGWDNGSNAIQYGHWDGSTAQLITLGAGLYNDNIYRQAVITCNAGSCIVYINGLSAGTGSLHNLSFTSDRGALGYVRTLSVQYYNGLLDNFFINTNVWTAAEVLRYYNFSSGRYATL